MDNSDLIQLSSLAIAAAASSPSQQKEKPLSKKVIKTTVLLNFALNLQIFKVFQFFCLALQNFFFSILLSFKTAKLIERYETKKLEIEDHQR